MGLFSKREHKAPDVCIPEHARIKLEKMSKENAKEEMKEQSERKIKMLEANTKLKDIRQKDLIWKAYFEVTGVYSVAKTFMVTGFLESGNIKKKMSTEIEGKKLDVTDIMIAAQKVNRLFEGQDGTLFLKCKGFPVIQRGDYLKFE